MSGSIRSGVLPRPPYYAAIFMSQRNAHDDPGYARASTVMAELAAQQPGFPGMDSLRGESGFGITVSYWTSEDAIRAWRMQGDDAVTREQGRRGWYEHYELRVARVERAYDWLAAAGPDTTP